jgi:TRAP-type C4-dicarboxylate transport system permease large subunit
MVASSHTDLEQQQRGWFPAWRALLSLCWRLSVLLIFLMGICVSIVLGHWWAVVACFVGFVVAALIVRSGSTVEPKRPSEDSIVFL